MSADYEFDVFVSYKREPPEAQVITPWIDGVLKRVIFWLKQELGGRDVSIFFDRDTIDIGDKWPDTLRFGLRRSRCMVGIWSPEYFRSHWCVSEWRSFLAREEHISAERRGLIAPIKFHDGKWFPSEAQTTQTLDLSGYAGTTEAFWKTMRAEELDQKLSLFAGSLARIVDRAPPFSPDWPVVEEAPLARPRGFEMERL